MTPTKVKERKDSFTWKTATPAEKANELKRVGDFKTARNTLQDPCCICTRKIEAGDDYRVFHNNNKWKGHEKCILSGGMNVAQIRGVVKTESGGERIYWKGLTKPEIAMTLLKRGETYHARANTDRLCDLCGKRLKPGEQCIADGPARRVAAHKEEAVRIAAEYKAKKIAELRQAEAKFADKDAAARAEAVKAGEARLAAQQLKVAEGTAEYVSFESSNGTQEAVMDKLATIATGGETLSQLTSMPDDIFALKLRVLELEAELKGFREAVRLMGGGNG
jgi:hypothetical protein